MPDQKTLPEVRQCADPESPMFGAVAVAASLGDFKWAVMHPHRGGHWTADDSEVADWPPPPASKTAARKRSNAS